MHFFILIILFIKDFDWRAAGAAMRRRSSLKAWRLWPALKNLRVNAATVGLRMPFEDYNRPLPGR